MDTIKIETPIDDSVVSALKAGDMVSISGTIYTGRDAAHKRMQECIAKGQLLPFDIKNQIIYYVGPCPPKPGQIIGSAGPTTSGRVDAYTPELLDRGLKGMIGKGMRSEQVVQSMIKNKAVYFAAVGGAGALISKSIKKADVCAYPDLGPEAIYRLQVEDFVVVVAIDCMGNNLYER